MTISELLEVEASSQEQARIVAGWQCPECFGCDTGTTNSHKAALFTCYDCGAQWATDYYGED